MLTEPTQTTELPYLEVGGRGLYDERLRRDGGGPGGSRGASRFPLLRGVGKHPDEREGRPDHVEQRRGGLR